MIIKVFKYVDISVNFDAFIGLKPSVPKNIFPIALKSLFQLRQLH